MDAQYTPQYIDVSNDEVSLIVASKPSSSAPLQSAHVNNSAVWCVTSPHGSHIIMETMAWRHT